MDKISGFNIRPGSSEPVAIIGMACRFPGGANDPESFWEILKDGKDAITRIPPDRIDIDKLFDSRPGQPGKIYQQYGGFLDQIDNFDPEFFGISPREAMFMDPQQRALLEVTYEALENGGQKTESLRGSSTGVFIGIWSSDYEAQMREYLEDIDVYATTGSGRYTAAGRLSFAFDFRGPSLSVDTACSSSLVAVHLACRSIQSGESELAIAGGVNLIMDPFITVGYSRSRMLSPLSRCRFGDAQATGYVRAEGVGAVALKPLRLALRDKDPIQALIRGSAVNNDGHSGDFLMQPSAEGQIEMLNRVYQEAGVSPQNVVYVECHGTGTRVGDPTELKAIGAVLGKGRNSEQILPVGSVKTNLGHTESAAGIAGLIKTVLCLRHRQIPASLNVTELNPEIPFKDLNVKIQTRIGNLTQSNKPALAGVNSFGITGTNAHVILEEAPSTTLENQSQEEDSSQWKLLTLSARGENLKNIALRWRDFLRSQAGTSLPLKDILYSAIARRSALPERMALLGRNHEELAARLGDLTLDENPPDVFMSNPDFEPGGVIFVFSGQGPDYFHVIDELLKIGEIRNTLIQCDEIIEKIAGWSLTKELNEKISDRLNRTEFSQPIICAIQIALANYWQKIKIIPNAVIGHSRGEVAAAYTSGALSLEDTLRVAIERGRIAQNMQNPGKMGVVEMTPEAIEEFLSAPEYKNQVYLAAINSPRNVLLSGNPEALEQAIKKLSESKIFARVLDLDFASHCPHVTVIREELLKALADIQTSSSRIPFYSTVFGEQIEGAKLDADYWWQNVRNPVLFGPTISKLNELGNNIFLEIAPQAALTGAITASIPSGNNALIIPSIRREESVTKGLNTALGRLHCAGIINDISHLYEDGRFVSIPSYSWNHKRYWFNKTSEKKLSDKPVRLKHPASFDNFETQNSEISGSFGSKEKSPNQNRSKISLIELSKTIRNEACQVMGLSGLKPKDYFFQKGMDSLMAVELAGRLSAKFGVFIESTIIFDFPDIESLSEHLNVIIKDLPEHSTSPGEERPSVASVIESQYPENQTESLNETAEINTVSNETTASNSRFRKQSENIKDSFRNEPIAVVGMSCRFPGDANTPSDFWNNLLNGVDAVSRIPANRFNPDDFYDRDPQVPGHMNTREGAFLRNITDFDANFFGISPREAIGIDPQQRLILEVAFEALEDAGIPFESLRGSQSGVYIGMTLSDYLDIQKKQNDPRVMDTYTVTGGAPYSVAGRLSYFLGLQGPSMKVDAACASSLVTVHLACQALRNGEINLGLAGGVNLILLADSYIYIAQSGALSGDGRCKTFDSAADGYGRAEGCGVVALKRLSDAERDGDDILALIRGSAVAQDGASGGLTIPNGRAQQNLIRMALNDAGIAPENIDYIEAHGTGTSLGDPIELNALGAVLGKNRPKERPLMIGSVKTNIGHTEAAAGIAGLIKTILALKAKKLPAHLHLKSLNPKISLEKIPAEIPLKITNWNSETHPNKKRMAGVSSFGISGTLAHVILEESPADTFFRADKSIPITSSSNTGGAHLLSLSAKSEGALKEVAAAWAGAFADERNSLSDLCFVAARKKIITINESALHFPPDRRR